MSVSALQDIIGLTVGALLNVGVIFLGFTSLGGAFVSGCPFHSTFSSAIRFVFEKPQTLFKWILRGRLSLEWLRKLWIGTLALLCAAATGVTLYATTTVGIWSSLFFLLAAFPMAYCAHREAVHKPQKYKIPHLALWVFLSISALMILAMCFRFDGTLIPMLLFGAGGSDIGWAIVIFNKMSKSMADTGEIDAIAWLLKTAPPQYPAAFFKKVGQMTGFDFIGCHYRPRLLESLMPFLTILIISHHTPEQPSSDNHSPSSSLSLDEDPHWKNLEIYIACLA